MYAPAMRISGANVAPITELNTANEPSLSGMAAAVYGVAWQIIEEPIVPMKKTPKDYKRHE